MRKLQVEECVIDRCDKCFGIWLDKGERLKLIADKRRTDMIDIGALAEKPEEPEATEARCPRDGEMLERRQHPDQKHIHFGQCANCGGSFFDAGDLRDLSRLSISDLVKNLFGLK
jgi:Zn-finger nucleic acid-binding protein